MNKTLVSYVCPVCDKPALGRFAERPVDKHGPRPDMGLDCKHCSTTLRRLTGVDHYFYKVAASVTTEDLLASLRNSG